MLPKEKQLQQAWDVFACSGKIDDYMRYKRLEQRIGFIVQEGTLLYADHDRWPGDPGEKIPR